MNTKEIAIRAKNLRKAFRIYKTPFDAFAETISSKKRHDQSLALDDVNLELRRGEIVGILGRNGAGKSTLLKLIAGTLERTSGELEVNGRITAILELGTGFHPDYTGRENIYMGGLCLGMSRKEINAKLDSIIEFSELKDVIDQPFKTYSTGMQARLTFSTAISVDPDILIVDEALSVGDARFQMKCFAWLQKLRAKNTTVLLVSHDTNTITTVCDRAIILEGGRVYAEGDAKKITSIYHNLLFGNLNALDEANGMEGSIESEQASNPITSEMPHINQSQEKHTLRYGSGEAEIMSWGITNDKNKHVYLIESGSPFKLSMTCICKVDIADLSYGFAIKDRRGTVLWGQTNTSQNLAPRHFCAGEKITIVVDGVMWLAAGDYFVNFGLAHIDNGEKIDFFEDGIEFKVTGPKGLFTTSSVNLQSHLSIEMSSEQNIKASI